MARSTRNQIPQQTNTASQTLQPLRPVGRPPVLITATVEFIAPLLQQDPPPTLTAIAVHCGCSRQRLWDWAAKDPALKDALQLAKTRHELRTLERLESKTADINAMFLLKAAHGYTDRPQQIEHTGTVKVVIESRVITDGKKDTIEAEFSDVSE